MSCQMVEGLESRRYFAASAVLKSGVLTVTGTDGVDAISVLNSNAKTIGVSIQQQSGGLQKTFKASSVKTVKIFGLGGDDTIYCYGLDGTKVKLTVDAGAGNDTVQGTLNGPDTLIGGPGKDSLRGGLGKVTFLTKGDGSRDQIFGHKGDTVKRDSTDTVSLV